MDKNNVNNFRYGVYYKHNSVDPCDMNNCFPKDREEIDYALRRFPSELTNYLANRGDLSATCDLCNNTNQQYLDIDPNNVIYIAIGTTHNEALANEACEHCLRGLGLVGKSLQV